MRVVAPQGGLRSAGRARDRRVLLLAVLLACLSGCGRSGELVQHFVAASDEPAARVLFIAGQDSHGPRAHEHREGSLLLARDLHQQQPDFDIQVVYGGWPLDAYRLRGIDSVVFYCDGGAGLPAVGWRGHPVNAHLEQFQQLLEEGVGVAALHYAVEVPSGGLAATLMQRAIGGYFETHWSVNPHWTASFDALPEHAVTREVEPFTLHDEWYFNMRFVPGMVGVLPLLSAVPPPDTVERDNGPHSGNDAVRKLVAAGVPQVVAWLYERPDGGRGFGYTGGHFHANWENENTRRLVVNAIAWTARSPR